MATPRDTSLMLKNQPMFRCCEHCKVAYCPEWAGHYVVCPAKSCVVGHLPKPKGNTDILFVRGAPK